MPVHLRVSYHLNIQPESFDTFENYRVQYFNRFVRTARSGFGLEPRFSEHRKYYSPVAPLASLFQRHVSALPGTIC